MFADGVLISIHAPARGATDIDFKNKQLNVFQSTLPHGERLMDTMMDTVRARISIHAPARGATESSGRF